MEPVLEQKFDYKGYPCVVLFMPGAYRCGYVGLPKGHKLSRKSVDDLYDLDCHGGVTYSEPHLFGNKDKENWWIGFDCAHYHDGYDIEAEKRYFGNSTEFLEMFGSMQEIWHNANKYFKPCSLTYVKNECMRLVDQIEKE